MEAAPVAQLLEFGFLACALGVGLSVLPVARDRFGARMTHGMAAFGGLLFSLAAVGSLLGSLRFDLLRLPLLPALGEVHFRVDPLSALFLLLIGLLSLGGSIYAIGYTAGQAHDAEPYPAFLGGLWNLFIAAMAGVVLAADGMGFLLAWEVMSVVSFLLVMAEHRKTEVRQAGYFYVVMTHIGTAFLIAAFLMLYARTGSLEFSGFKGAAAGLTEGTRNFLFLALLIGFGTKAGLVPLHLWLPRAHPAAPSHVSALMSGVMVKTALYGMLRLALDVLGSGPAWWGAMLVVVGGVSAVTGALYATQQGHLKRLLAYSTVENIGLLFMTTGGVLWAQAKGLTALATLALGAVLFHALSHAAFKGLAFMGAGAVLHGAGTVEIERLGGLIRRMPKAAVFFLVAAMAIAGLPPLSGFMGEWFSLQSFLNLTLYSGSLTERLIATGAIGAIALAAGLAAAAAVKAFGISFLALPRSRAAETAHDAGFAMLLGMAVPAVLVFLMGTFPSAVLRLVVAPVTGQLVGEAAAAPTFSGITNFGEALSGMTATPATLVVMGALLMLVTVVLGRGWPRWRRDITWTCGITPSARMEYSGAGFSKPILLMFRGLLQPVRSLQVDKSDHPLFLGRVHYQSELSALFEQYLYRPVTRTVMAIASRMRRTQTGSLQTYLLYLLLAAVGVIVAAR